jgi:MEMO1 family protein
VSGVKESRPTVSLARRPKLRPLDPFLERRGGETVLGLRDPEGLFDGVLLASPALASLLPLLDGERTPTEVASEWARRTGGSLPLEECLEVLADLDARLLLEGDAVDAARARALAVWRALPARPPACAGNSYPADRAACEAFLAECEAAAAAPVVPAGTFAVLAPHIDLRGGGACHGAAARALAACDADTFVILGTAHAAIRRPFALTAHDFDTPIGRVATDRAIVERLARRGGGSLLSDELAHRTEHSVEFQALWLAHALRERPVKIVPVLVGSIAEAIRAQRSPGADPAVADFVAALRELAAEAGRRVAVVASVDLAHVGPRYGDDRPVDAATLAATMAGDRPLLDAAARGDAEAWARALSAERDRRNVCGAAPTYVFLAAIAGEGVRGTLLRHDEWRIDPETRSHVSFAAMAFARDPGSFSREAPPSGARGRP